MYRSDGHSHVIRGRVADNQTAGTKSILFEESEPHAWLDRQNLGLLRILERKPIASPLELHEVISGCSAVTIPAYILSGLPAGSSGVGIQNDIYQSMPASGLDIGIVGGEIGMSVISKFK